MRIQKLANVCPKADIPVCHIVEVSVVHSWSLSLNFLNFEHQAYLWFQLGINAFDGAYDNEAADHFTAVVDTIAFTSQSAIHSKYEDFVVVC